MALSLIYTLYKSVLHILRPLCLHQVPAGSQLLTMGNLQLLCSCPCWVAAGVQLTHDVLTMTDYQLKLTSLVCPHLYVACSKSFRTSEIARQLDILAMSRKVCCLVACFIIIILFATSSCCD
jgi:hypothetical protein